METIQIFNVLENLRIIYDDSKLIEEILIHQMSVDELKGHLEYFCRMHDINIDDLTE